MEASMEHYTYLTNNLGVKASMTEEAMKQYLDDVLKEINTQEK
jgi:polyhydroxyalkanoate synthesis regulator phasin